MVNLLWPTAIACIFRGNLYNTYTMKVLTTTQARARIKSIVDRAKYRGEAFAIGRRHSIDAVVIGFPEAYNKDVDDITNVNAYSRSFDFLAYEPDLYSPSDVKRKHA